MPRATRAIARNPFDPFAAPAVVDTTAGVPDDAAADAGVTAVADAGVQSDTGTAAAAAGDLGAVGIAGAVGADAEVQLRIGATTTATATARAGVGGDSAAGHSDNADAAPGTEADSSELSSPEVSEPVYEADSVLLAATDRARQALLEITPRATIGDCVGHTVEGDRVLSLRFKSVLPGYPGWFWTVTLSREEASQNVNVLEMELLPGPDALRAPEWIPWSVRLAEYHAQQRARRAAAEAAGDEPPEDELAAELGVGDDEFDDDFDELEDDALSDIAGAHDVPLDFDDPLSDFELDEDAENESPERDFDLEVVE